MPSDNDDEFSDHEFHDAVTGDEKIDEVTIPEDNLHDKRIEEESKLNETELEERKNVSSSLKDEGNEFYKNQEYEKAITKYSEALVICPLKYEKENSIILSNRAACYKACGKTEDSLNDTNEALKLNPNYIKCLIRRAELLYDSEDYEDSLKDYKKILELDPNNKTAKSQCIRLPSLIEEKREKMKEEMFTQLKSLGNMVLKPFGLSTNNFKLNKDENTGGYSINFTQ